MIHSCATNCQDFKSCIYTCDKVHWSVWYDSLVCNQLAGSLVFFWDSHVWQSSLIWLTCLIHVNPTGSISVSHVFTCTHNFIDLCGMTHACATNWQDGWFFFLKFTRVATFIDLCDMIGEGGSSLVRFQWLCPSFFFWNSHVWQNLLICVQWLTHVKATGSTVVIDLFTCADKFNDLCDMAYVQPLGRIVSYVCNMTNLSFQVTWLMYVCDMTHPYVNMTYSYAWHDAFKIASAPRTTLHDVYTCVTWLIPRTTLHNVCTRVTWLIPRTTLHDLYTCVTWLIPRTILHNVWTLHNVYTCVTWLIPRTTLATMHGERQCIVARVVRGMTLARLSPRCITPFISTVAATHCNSVLWRESCGEWLSPQCIVEGSAGALAILNASGHTYEWVMLHVWMSHVTHIHESCQRAAVVRGHLHVVWVMCATWRMYVCDKTHVCVWHDACTCVTHLYVWHGACGCVTWLMYMCDMTHPYV